MDNAHRDSIRLLRATLITAIIVPLALCIYACWLDYEGVHDVAEKQIERTTDVVNEHALKVLEAVERAIAEVGEIVRDMPDNQVAAQQATLHTRLRRIVQTSSQIKSLWIFGSNGQALVNSLTYPADDTDFSDRDYFAAHVEKDVGTFVGTVLRPRAPYGGAPFFGISRRRPSLDGSFTGVIQASVLPDYFEGFYQKLSREPGAYASLVHENGMLLARYPSLERNVKLAEQGPLYQAMLKNPVGGRVTLISAIDGQGRTVSYRKLAEFPVFVLAGLSTRAMWEQWLVQVERKLMFGLPAAAALIAIVGLALRRTRKFYAEATARQAAETALKQSQRLEALGQLTGGVAHDFNNLLMVVGGSAQRIRSRAPDPRIERSISMIEAAVEKGTNLTRQLLSFSRRQSLTPKVVDLAVCVRNFADVLRQSLHGDVRIHFAIPDEIFAVHIDRNEFEIALLNLVLNARDSMDRGGDIRVALGHGIKLTRQKDDPTARTVTLSVTDNGAGIPEEIREHVFEPYFTTKKMDKGTGLGLSQVYGFAQQSGGKIEFETETGRGSTFTLILPKSDLSVETDNTPAPLAKPTFSLHVLLVEDNADVAAVAVDYLEQCGATVAISRSAEEAIAKLNRNDKVDLVLSDIVMPGMNGVDLARWIRRRYPQLPIILASGYSNKAQEGQSEGFMLLSKPYSLETLRVALATTARSDAAPARQPEPAAQKRAADESKS